MGLLMTATRLSHVLHQAGLLSCVCVVAAVCLTPSSLSADLVADAEEASTNVLIVALDSEVNNVDNDNVVGPSSNTLDITVQIAQLTQLDIILTPTFTPGTTEYLTSTRILNATGNDIDSFRLQLGVGAFDGVTDSFSPQSSQDLTFANFDFPDVDSPFNSDVWSDVNVTAHEVEFSNGVLEAGEFADIQFTLDFPTNQPFVTIRGTATNAVPEPGQIVPLTLAGLGCVAFAIRRRRMKAKLASASL